MPKQLDRFGRPLPVYLSDVLYITPAQILDALSRAERFAPDEKNLEKYGDGVGLGPQRSNTGPSRPTRLHYSVMQNLDRRSCQQVRIIEDYRTTPLRGWVRVRVFYVLNDKRVEIDQDLPQDIVDSLSNKDISDRVAERYDYVWGMEDEHTRLKMLLPLIPRIKKNGQPDGKRKAVAPEGYALWHTFPKLKLRRMVHPIERMHDPHRPDYNRIPQWGHIEAWDTAPKPRDKNIKVYVENIKTPLMYVGPDAMVLAGWKPDIR